MTDASADDDLLYVARYAFFEREMGDRIGVAVSGGSDSMAMLHIFHAAGFTLEAATVDHGLRPEAADEAQFVADACARLGLRHETLQWRDHPKTGNVPDLARQARYGLLRDWAKRRGLRHILIGHTVDDQAETFLMRLARDAGVDGLSGMRQMWSEDGVWFRRPMLQRSRADLRGWLERHGIGWVDDPSNDDPRYDRVKARKALTHLAPLGIDAQTLAMAALRMSSARDSLKLAARYVAEQTCRMEGGDVIVPRRVIGGIHGEEIGRRLMIAALRVVDGSGYPPRETSLQRVQVAIFDGKATTLAGCRISREEEGIRFTREYRAVRDLVTPTTVLWDGRWRLSGPHADHLTIRALGAEGLKECPDWRATVLPRASLLASPAVWDGSRLIAAPLAGRPEEWTATLAEHRNTLSQVLLSD